MFLRGFSIPESVAGSMIIALDIICLWREVHSMLVVSKLLQDRALIPTQ